MQETWKQFKERVQTLTEPERSQEAIILGMLWEDDWDFFQEVYHSHNLSNEEIRRKKAAYFKHCHESLIEAFGYDPGNCGQVDQKLRQEPCCVKWKMEGF